jgi:hypothetical protein
MREFEKIFAQVAQAVRVDAGSLLLRKLTAAPIDATAGVIAHADGSGWNPGNGAGPYFHNGTLWLPFWGAWNDGSGSGLDADLLDSYHASQTPTGNTVPVSQSDKHLSWEWKPWWRGCVVSRASDQTLSNSSETLLAWTEEVLDTDGIHDNSTNNSRFTIPSGVTLVKFVFNFFIATPGTAYDHYLNTYKNGSLLTGKGAPMMLITGQSPSRESAISQPIQVSGGDYIEFKWQNNAAANDTLYSASTIGMHILN